MQRENSGKTFLSNGCTVQFFRNAKEIIQEMVRRQCNAPSAQPFKQGTADGNKYT
jgi:hypothetical protein